MNAPVVALLALSVWTLGAAVCVAQTPQPLPATGFQDGFFVQTPDGEYRMVFGAVVQTDGRFSFDDPSPVIGTFTVRKIRPTISGRAGRYFEFKLTPEFAGGTPLVLDANVDVRLSPRLRVRAGKDKSPVGYEVLISDPFLIFPERSLASGLLPNRDVGFHAQGDLTSWLSYSGGVFNGVPDGTNSTSDLDANDGKDLAARVVIRHAGAGFQIGGSTGNQEGALPTFRTSVGQTYFSYAPGVVADGRRTRITPAVFYYVKSLGVFAEFAQSRQDVRRAEARQTFANKGWNVTASYLLTGEVAGTSYVRPRALFSPPDRRWGAFQVAIRLAQVNFDRDIAVSGFGASGSPRRATQFTAGINWYATPYIKGYVTYENTSFESDIQPVRPDENVVLFRLQLGI